LLLVSSRGTSKNVSKRKKRNSGRTLYAHAVLLSFSPSTRCRPYALSSSEAFQRRTLVDLGLTLGPTGPIVSCKILSATSVLTRLSSKARSDSHQLARRTHPRLIGKLLDSVLDGNFSQAIGDLIARRVSHQIVARKEAIQYVLRMFPFSHPLAPDLPV